MTFTSRENQGRWASAKIHRIITLAAALSFLTVIVAVIGVKGDLSHPEGAVVWAAYRMHIGQSIYQNWEEWPHRFMPYGPLLIAPLAVLADILRLDFSFSYYIAGRLQSAIYMLLICFVGSTWISGVSSGRLAKAAFIVSFIALWPGIAVPAISFRADAPATFWALAAFSVLFHPKCQHRFLATPLFLLSVSYKPSLWAFIPAALSILAFRNQITTGFRFAAASIAVVAGYILLLEWATDGLFLKNQVGASAMGFSMTGFHIIKNEILALNWIGALSPTAYPLFAAALFRAIHLIRQRHHPHFPLAIYFLWALIINHVTLAKSGAALNYLLESYVVGGVLLAAVVHPLINGRYVEAVAATKTKVITICSMILFAISVPYNIYMAKTALQQWSVPLETQRLLRLPGKPFLGDAAFIHPVAEAHDLNDPLPYFQLLDAGKISPQPFLARLQNQEFSVVVLSPAMQYLMNRGGKSVELIRALEQRYTPDGNYTPYQTWHPRR